MILAEVEKRKISRRAFYFAPAALGGAVAAWWFFMGEQDRALPDAAADGSGSPVELVLFSVSGAREGERIVRKAVKSEAAWRKDLSQSAFAVTRNSATEYPFTGRYWRNNENGIYRCVACGNALFTSKTKFESGTGWPSFWAPIAEANLYTRVDRSLGLRRSEVLCRKCDGHLGHVFQDGPPPTGLRYCMNSAAMRFVKTA